MIRYEPMTTEEEWRWIEARAHPIMCADTQGIVAYAENGRILAMCVADSFTTDSCSVHLAIDNPSVIRRGFLAVVATHLFETCNRKRIFGLVPSNNAKALRFDVKIGFREVARIPDAIRDGVDYVVLRMDKEKCRWLKREDKDGQRDRSAEAA